MVNQNILEWYQEEDELSATLSLGDCRVTPSGKRLNAVMERESLWLCRWGALWERRHGDELNGHVLRAHPWEALPYSTGKTCPLPAARNAVVLWGLAMKG